MSPVRPPGRVPRPVLIFALLLGAPLAAQSVYEKDVAFALEEIPKHCALLLEAKKIAWSEVAKEFGAAAKKVKTPEDHLGLLTRLLARLRDGHAAVQRREPTKDLKWPDGGQGESAPCGLYFCRAGKRILVKTAWGSAAAAGVEAGMEVLKVDGTAAEAWLAAQATRLAATISFSTEHQAFFYACQGGMTRPTGTRLELELKDLRGQAKKRMVTCEKSSFAPRGPAAFPPGLERTKDLAYGLTARGNGYIYLRRCPEDLPTQTDEALAKVGAAPGLILDFRANGGGGFDHEAFMGRFVPQGQVLAFGSRYESAGPRPYGGRIVVIVDGTTISAGETAAGIFKEDGRAYMIGESPTAGMSSQKTTIELPSGLFGLYVSTRSNKQRFNGGRGIEGLGVIPHEMVAFDPKDLAAGVDTLIRRAEELLAKFPDRAVPYRPR